MRRVDDASCGRCAAKLVRPYALQTGRSCRLIALEASALTAIRGGGTVDCLDFDLHGSRPHLDVKPENVILGRTPRLLDFSIAQRVASAAAAAELVGTPAYMAPEQRPGATHPLGPAADVFALARTLAEALTGAPPPQGSVRPHMLPAPFERVLGPALAPRPELRGDRPLARDRSARAMTADAERSMLGAVPGSRPWGAARATAARRCRSLIATRPRGGAPRAASRTCWPAAASRSSARARC